jgi:hypothetical protein
MSPIPHEHVHSVFTSMCITSTWSHLRTRNYGTLSLAFHSCNDLLESPVNLVSCRQSRWPCSIDPFPASQVEALDIETLLSSQGSRIVNVEKSSIVCSFLIPGGIPTWSTSTDFEWGFSVHEQRFLNLMLMATVLFGFVKLTINELSSYIFYLSILWTSLW